MILILLRPFLVLALEHLLSLILSQVPLIMRSTLLTETQRNMMKQTLSLELVFFCKLFDYFGCITVVLSLGLYFFKFEFN